MMAQLVSVPRPEMTDSFCRGRGIRSHLAALGPAAVADLGRILEAPNRTPVLRALTARPASAGLATPAAP